MNSALAAFLLNALVQIPPIALAAAIGARLLRNAPARQQHLVWVLALVLSLVIPATGMVPRRVQKPPSVRTAVAQATALTPKPEPEGERQLALPQSRRLPVSQILTLAYGAFILYRAIALFAAWRRTRRIVRAASGSLDIDGVRVLTSNAIATPMTVGAFRPVILVPAALLDDVSNDALTALVGHERAHIRRQDFLVNLALELIALPIAFHPVVWLLKRRVALTRELACDEEVTPALVAPRAYARALVDIASFACGRTAPMVSLTMAGTDFEQRIRSIVNERSLKTSRILIGLACAALIATAAMAAGFGVHPTIDVQRLTSKNAEDRAAAACDARQARDAAAIPALLAMLGDDTPIAPVLCIDMRWMPAMQSFERPSPGEQAALALAAISTPAVEPLVSALDDRSPVVRRNAAWAIGEVRGSISVDRDAALEPLIRHLSDPDATVRRAAAFGLSELKQKAAVPPLIASLAGDGDPAVRTMSAFALGEIRDARAVAALDRAARDDADSQVRRRAKWALHEIID